MSPRTVQQNEAIRQQKMDHIKSTALELFSANGFHATSISDIAKAAKISKGLLYNYFTSKDDLLSSIIDDGFRKLIISFDPDHDGILTQDELVFFINSVVEMIKNDKPFWRLYMSLLLQPAVHHSKILEGFKERADFIFTMLKDYYKRKGRKDPDEEITMIHLIMDGAFFNYLYDDDFQIETVKKLIIDRFV